MKMTAMTKMKKNISGFLCEQPDLRPVSPCVALCAICLGKTGGCDRPDCLRGVGRLSRFVSKSPF